MPRSASAFRSRALALALLAVPFLQTAEAAIAIQVGHRKFNLKPHKLNGDIASTLSKVKVAKSFMCPVAEAQLAIPTTGDVSLVTGTVPNYIGLGIGSISYVCGDDAKTWTPTKQEASIYDISCTYNASTALNATDTWFNNLTALAATLHTVGSQQALGSALDALTGLTLVQLGELTSTTAHDNATDISFDFTAAHDGNLKGTKGKVTGALKASQDAPVASYNIPWTQYQALDGSGTLAQAIYQVQTAGGIPATNGLSCTPGQSDSVPYTAQYWFFTTPAAANTTITTKNCKVPSTTKKQRQMAVLMDAVIYGATDKTCTSAIDCTEKCLADSACQGFSLSTEDNAGYTKTGINAAGLIYSPVFTSGVVQSITNKQYITRQGGIDNCPAGQITAADNLGCVLPTC